MKKRILKLTAFAAALALLAGVLWFSNGLLGNPVSKFLAARAAVQAHLQSCPACRALAGQAAPPPPVPDGAALLRRVRRGTRGFALVVLLAGALFGMGLSGSMDMFYNSLLMPAMGAAAWFVWRWKAAAVLPPLLAGMSLVCWGLRWGWGMETGPLPGYLIWAAIYCVLALVGVAIAGLFHFALKKEG